MRRPAALAVIPIVALVASCSSGSVASSVGQRSSAAATSFTDWPTYHRTSDRAGKAVHPITGGLHRSWARHLDGAVYGEPLVVHGTLIVATENDSVYGLNPRTGNQRWRTHLGTPQDRADLPCGNIDPLGITGTPAYDETTGSVFVVAETSGGHHALWALNAATGHRRWHRSTDVLPSRNRKAEQQRSALLVTAGRVITDAADYVSGQVRQAVTAALTEAGAQLRQDVAEARAASREASAGVQTAKAARTTAIAASAIAALCALVALAAVVVVLLK